VGVTLILGILIT